MAARKRTTSPAFQFYPKDYLSSSKVQMMTWAERGLYTSLLCHYWLDGGLPDDERRLARMLGVTRAAIKKAWSGPLGECFKAIGGRLVNERLDHERRVQAEFKRKQKERAESRWNATRGNATALPKRRNASLPQSASASTSIVPKGTTEGSAEPPSDSSPAFLTFPTVGGTREWVLTEGQVYRWGEDYPHTDVFAECRKARAWVEANPEKRKTARGMPAFLVRWLGKAADRGGGSGPLTVVNRGDKTVGNEDAIRRFIERRQG